LAGSSGAAARASAAHGRHRARLAAARSAWIVASGRARTVAVPECLGVRRGRGTERSEESGWRKAPRTGQAHPHLRRHRGPSCPLTWPSLGRALLVGLARERHLTRAGNALHRRLGHTRGEAHRHVRPAVGVDEGRDAWALPPGRRRLEAAQRPTTRGGDHRLHAAGLGAGEQHLTGGGQRAGTEGEGSGRWT